MDSFERSFKSFVSLWTLFLIFFVFHPGIILADISGSVIDEDGNPVADAWITTQGAVSIRSDATGAFYLSLPDGTYTVSASLPGYFSQTKENVASSASPSLTQFTLAKSMSLSPNIGLVGQPRDFTVSGSGFDEQTKAWSTYDFTNSALTFSVADTGGFSGYAEDVVLVGTIAYVANYNSGVILIDISDPADPKTIKEIPTPGPAVAVTVAGTIAYVATEDAGLQFIDITEPANASLIGNGLVTPGKAVDVVVANNIAYVADWDAGLQIINVVNPSNPQIIKTIPTDTYATEVAVDGNIVYVTDNYDSLIVDMHLYVIDVTDPTTASVITTERVYNKTSSLTVDNDILYITSRTGLEMWDVSQPDSPIFFNAIGFSSTTCTDVFVKDGFAYVTEHNIGLTVLDVSVPSQAWMVGIVKSPLFAFPQGVVVEDNIAYIASASAGLHIVDVSNLSIPEPTGHYETGIAKDVAVAGDIAYVVNWHEPGFQIVDISDSTNPQYLGSMQTMGGVTDIQVIGDYAYLASSGLDIINVTNPAAPNPVFGNYLSSGRSIEIVGDYAYVAYQNGLQIYNISDPSNVLTLGNVATPGQYARDVKVVGSIAYVADKDYGLQVIDVSDPSAPYIRSQVDAMVNPDAEANGVFVVNNTAYVIDGGQVWLVNVTDADDPQVLSSLWLPAWCNDIVVDSNKAYVAHLNGVDVIDVSDTSNPKRLGALVTFSDANSVLLLNNKLYIAEDAGLTILDPFDDYFFEVPLQYNAAAPGQLLMENVQRDIAGDYNLTLVKSTGAVESQTGAFSITDNPDLFNAKAIVVAGGGELASGNVWQQTKDYANQAYSSLKYQGYGDDQIRYLTDQLDAPGRDGPADKVSLQAALTWAQVGPTSNLIVYLVDHGEDERFMIKGGNPAEYVTVEELDSWLDSFQNSFAGDVELLFVYDACKSGSFIRRMVPPAGKTRVNITSSAADQSAYFLSEKGSFSSHFWSVFSGKAGERVDIFSAWNRASLTMSMYQSAQLDANGNRLANEPEDIDILRNLDFPFGRGWLDNNQRRPEVGSVSADQVLSGGETGALLMANDVRDADNDLIVRTWAEIQPPELPPTGSDLTVTSTIEVDLIEENTPGIYEGRYENFTEKGTYIVTFFTMDADGLVSLPKTSLVTQSVGVASIPADDYEDDSSMFKAKGITVDSTIPQIHTFHVSGDQDWVKFYGLAGKVYNIRAIDPTIISDPNITLYNSNGAVLQTSSSGAPGQEESIIGWTCPLNGTYYVRVTNDSAYFGANVWYKLWVYNPEALTLPTLPGTVSGTVVSGSTPVSGALVSAGGAQPQYTNGSGGFTIFLPAGPYAITVVRDGYQSISFGGSVSSGQNISVSPPNMNSVPQIMNVPPTLVKAYELYSYVPVVSEPDGDSYTFSISGILGWASFNAVNGALTGMPSAADVGLHGPVAITVTDSAGASSSKVFTIEVKEGTGGAMPGVFLLLMKP